MTVDEDIVIESIIFENTGGIYHKGATKEM